MKRFGFLLLVVAATALSSRVLRADDWDLENMPPTSGAPADDTATEPAAPAAPATQPIPPPPSSSAFTPAPSPAPSPAPEEAPRFNSEHKWAFDIGAGIMPFGPKQTTVPGVLDQEHMYSIPLGVGYYLTPNIRIDSGLELQFYNATNSMPYAGLSQFNAFTIKIPLILSYEAKLPSSPLFFDVGAGAAVNIPVSARLINQVGMDVSGSDNNNVYFNRTRVLLQDDVVLAAGAKIGDASRVKLQLDLSPIAGSSNPVLMSTNPYALPDPSYGPYIGYSTFVLSLRLEMLQF